MPKRPKLAPENSADVQALSEAVEDLTHLLSDIPKLVEAVQGLAQQTRQLGLIMDEIREDLIYAVRNDKFSATHSMGEYQAVLEQISEAICDMEETNAPIGTKTIIKVPDEEPTCQPKESLF